MIPDELNRYIEEHTSTEDIILSELYRETHLKVIYSRMLSGQVQGKLLQFISQMIKPENILEIGTFTGYSAICLAKGLAPGGRLITIEKNDEIIDIPLKYFQKAGLSDKINLITGDAVKIVENLEEKFDLVFIDAEKKDYIRYYKGIIDKVRSGGFILADNVLWSGKVVNINAKDKDTIAIDKFNKYVDQDERVENIILPVRDGISIIRKK